MTSDTLVLSSLTPSSELNFCLEWDERSPVWGIGLVKSGPKPGKRKEIGVVQDRFANMQAPAPSSGGGGSTGVRRDRGGGGRERRYHLHPL